MSDQSQQSLLQQEIFLELLQVRMASQFLFRQLMCCIDADSTSIFLWMLHLRNSAENVNSIRSKQVKYVIFECQCQITTTPPRSVLSPQKIVVAVTSAAHVMPQVLHSSVFVLNAITQFTAIRLDLTDCGCILYLRLPAFLRNSEVTWSLLDFIILRLLLSSNKERLIAIAIL